MSRHLPPGHPQVVVQLPPGSNGVSLVIRLQSLNHRKVDKVQELIRRKIEQVYSPTGTITVELVPDPGVEGPSDESCADVGGRIPYSSMIHPMISLT